MRFGREVERRAGAWRRRVGRGGEEEGKGRGREGGLERGREEEGERREARGLTEIRSRRA